MFKQLLVACIATISFSQAFASSFQPYNGPGTWQNYQQLPHYEEWAWMYDDAEDIAQDLNSGGGKYYLEYKTRGGSSHQTLVRRTSDNGIMGIWSAPNHATYILGEIFAFQLARVLGRPNWVTPGTTMTLTGPGRKMAYKAYDTSNTPKARRCNRDTILNYMDKNPYYITGAYMAFTPNEKPESIPGLVDRSHKKRLNQGHFLVPMIQKNGPQPSGRTVYLNTKKRESTLSYSAQAGDVASTTDTQLAKQLSFMMLVDALNSQRDRFGPYGSNMEVMMSKKNGTVVLTAVDNGGIADSSNTVSKKFFLGEYGKGVSRFERDVFDRVIALDNLINKGITSDLYNYQNEQEVKLALGYEDNPSTGGILSKAPRSCRSNHSWLMAPLKTRWDKRWKAFKNALRDVAAHMRKFENQDKAFFN